MNRNTLSGFFVLIILVLCLVRPDAASAQVMSNYCQTPPFIGTGGEPNVLIVNDASGSMSWPAYSQNSSSDPIPYDAAKGYEGYFDPEKYYAPDVNGVYEEKASTGIPCATTCVEHICVKKKSNCANGSKYGGGTWAFGCTQQNKTFGCCTDITTSGDCNLESGNYLNYLNMARIDLLRWALTGGSPATCGASFDGDRCDPELWSQTGNSAAGKIGTVCNDSLDVNGDGVADGGCILEANNGTTVKVRWSRVYDGLVSQFMSLPLKPRLGAMSFSGSSSPYLRSQRVYIGDFLASNNNSAAFPYLNLIAHINSIAPNGGTPTGPALWDALNYFSMKAPQYGGFPAQSGAGDRWKNPLYICDGQGGNNCTLNSCARNFAILMSDGEWNEPSSSIGNNPSCSSFSPDPVVPAYCMHMGFTNVMGTADTGDDVLSKVSSVYTIGLFMNSNGLRAMQNTAMYGSFENTAHTWPGSLTGFPTNNNGSLGAPLPASSPDWDLNADGVPDTFYSSDTALGIKQKIMDAVMNILSHATSGTAASVLASGEGSGANLVQATYYPKRRFFSDSLMWTGGLQNLWYYIDPLFANSSIREDDGDRVLNLKTDTVHKDYIAQFYFDTFDLQAKARVFPDADGNGAPEAQIDTTGFEELGNLWEAGKLLWNRSASDRTIYTALTATQPLTSDVNRFSASAPNNTAALRPFLNADDAAATEGANNQLAANIINYVRGVDIANYAYASGTGTVTEIYRPRTVKIDLNGDGDASDAGLSVGGVAMDETVAKAWKLGDIINSTPRISSWVPLGGYDRIYNDGSYKSFTKSGVYTGRGMVYVGANDGMLHAFNLGTLELKWNGQDQAVQKARLTGADLGKELWAFIPRNVLPYLKYLKETDYCHINSVDLTPYLFDAAIGVPAACTAGDYWDCLKTSDSWRTILIGGMKLGGACRDAGSACTDCVKTPVSGNGYSAYFALDVTNQNNPRLLWEFSSAELGFTTTGPAVIRVSSRTAGATNSGADGGKTNGKWFVLFGSGPTGPIDPASQKFLGRSDQNLKLFVLDLKTGSLLRTIDTGIAYAFAGSLLNATLDSDLDYQDDAVYIPYVKRTGSGPAAWTDGGVLRLLTNEDLDGTDVSATGTTALNPATWRFSTVIDGIGPVTSSVVRMQNKVTGLLRLYFGAGRYFFKNSGGTDDADGQRRLFGIVEPCFEGGVYKAVCLDAGTGNDVSRTLAELGAVDLTTASGSTDAEGWYISLDTSGNFTYDENGNGTTADDVARSYNAERVITDPLASGTGVIYFTSYKPYNDQCSIGGKTFIWAVKYDTGAAAGSLLKGTALIQVSTGSIEQVSLQTAFKEKSGRRTGALEGVPPTGQGLSLMTTPPAVKRILHVRER